MKKLSCLLLAMVFASGCRTPQSPANPHANAQTKAVLKYFQSLEGRSDKRLLSGQFSNFGDRANLRLLDDIHDQTGHWPAIFGADYASRGGINTEAPNQAAIEYWQQGGLVTLSTHLYNPARTNAAFGGLRDKDVDLNTLLATNTETHARWMHELDQIADGLQQLQTNGVVVLWRPFHEMNGDWFWWDGKDPETFKKLWRQDVRLFHENERSGQSALGLCAEPWHQHRRYYPGDRYVDLVGLDAYTDFVDTNHILGYAEVARLPKPFGFTEFGPHGPAIRPAITITGAFSTE